MEENPYRSPGSAPGSQTRSTERPNWRFAAACGFFGFMGPFNLLAGLLAPFTSPLLRPYMVLPELLIPGIVGAAMARWAWRYPESKWVFPVAFLLGMSGFIPILLGVWGLGVYGQSYISH